MRSLLLALAFALLTSPAFAGKEMCKDVDINVTNELDSDIKVVDIEYWDYGVGTLRGEFGVKNKTVLEEDTKTWTRNIVEEAMPITPAIPTAHNALSGIDPSPRLRVSATTFQVATAGAGHSSVMSMRAGSGTSLR